MFPGINSDGYNPASQSDNQNIIIKGDNMYKPENLKKWEDKGSYFGEDLSQWYILVARTRDSYLLENSNFESIKAYLIDKGFEICGDVEETNTILLASFNHWACGWIESIMIHESNDKALIISDDIKAKLNDYPIFDEDHYYRGESALQWDYVREYIVEDYFKDNDIDYTDSRLDQVTSYLLQNYEFETNGYDEVITGDKFSMPEVLQAIDTES